MREVPKAQHDFQHPLQEYICRRVQAAGETIEGLMASDRFKEAWDHHARWLRHAREKLVHPTREGLDRESTVRD